MKLSKLSNHMWKNYSVILLLAGIVILISCKFEKIPNSNVAIESKVCLQNLDSLYGLIGSSFENEPRTAIGHLNKVLKMKNCDSVHYFTIGECLLNIGSIYDEKLDRVDSAIIYLNSSYDLFIINNDSMRAFNVYKYLGLLNVRSGNIDRGIYQINCAIEFYKNKNKLMPYYVSQRNYANALFMIGKKSEAIEVMEKVVSFWKSKNDLGRLEIYKNELDKFKSG